ncbi:hypothetical protein FRC12_005297 [Ceratobasidium sp. 428]|nr:hypothetical protein FRC12_005297 [Ceratobasidium sp. 428]
MQKNSAELAGSCLNCIKRNRRCDKAEPVCNACIGAGLFCQWHQHAGWSPLVSESPLSSHPDENEFSDGPCPALSHALCQIISSPVWLDQVSQPYSSLVRQDDHRLYCDSLIQTGRTLRTLTLDPGVISNTLPFIICQYVRFVQRIALKPLPGHFQDGLIVRSTASNMTFWSMFLAAQVYQALLNSFDQFGLNAYTRWIEQLSRSIDIGSDRDLEFLEMKNRVTVLVDLIGLKLIMGENASGYVLMKRAVPLIFHVAHSYPTIWTPSGTISLPHAIKMPNSEIANFIWMDNLAALMLGTATFLCYDAAPAQTVPGNDELEWVFGCPGAFVIILGRINALRSSILLRQNSIPSDMSSNLAAEIREWSSTIEQSTESCTAITRLVIQECWRHALLIYLYMGVDKVNSTDFRVISSVHQIVRLLGTIKNNSLVDRHLFVPSLIVGVSTQSEKHRGLVRKSLAGLSAVKIWILQGTEALSVLDHLWHGPGKGGSPVSWEDYVASRRAVLSVDEGSRSV